MQLEHNDKSTAPFLKSDKLPYLKKLPLQDNVVFKYLHNLYSTIAIHDIVNRYVLRNISPALKRVIDTLSK